MREGVPGTVAKAMLDLIQLRPEESGASCGSPEPSYMLDALDLAASPLNALAVGWTLARGEFDGLRVDVPVRMGGTAWG